MLSFPGIQNLHVIIKFCLCFYSFSLKTKSDPFFLHNGKERFDCRVVTTIIPSTRAENKSVVRAEPRPNVTTELGALVGVDDRRMMIRPAAPSSCKQLLDYPITMRCRASATIEEYLHRRILLDVVNAHHMHHMIPSTTLSALTQVTVDMRAAN